MFYPWQIISRITNLNLNTELKLNSPINYEKLYGETLNVIEKLIFNPHPDDRYGGWGALGLYTYGGNENTLETNKNYKIQETPILKLMPYTKSLINEIPAEKGRIRLMETKAKTKIYWHYDNSESIDEFLDTNNVRLHIPIITNDLVDFIISHQKVSWKPGRLYYGDFSYPHTVINRSNKTRIHLVMDFKVNKKLANLFDKNYLNQQKKRVFVKKFCQRSLNLFNKVKFKKN